MCIVPAIGRFGNRLKLDGGDLDGTRLRLQNACGTGFVGNTALPAEAGPTQKNRLQEISRRNGGSALRMALP